MNSKKRIFVSLSIFLLVFAIGVAGFRILGGPGTTLLNSIYMTVITISTIGYGEVVDTAAHPARRHDIPGYDAPRTGQGPALRRGDGRGRGSALLGKTIEESKLEERTGALFVALRKGGAKEFDFNPPRTTKLGASDVLVFIASPEMVQELEKISGT